ncbi:Thiol:disulfide interchange protein CycY precursor [Pseudovibrio axinellae]|uniref:Thiol:disulfide interchange protein CycY n=1 Tax=Pseudovibrio axinellae TaxID=989403 RepID=A0A166AZY4_9HYPH|nr:DsbE family thiol:disulfide interchange protein [Pseudovibrio axinellae]KZL21767.1 Thiol:disulfide interchange protein CycY precursor [Pseudovibrio axinellae]SEQ22510.1 cytochrome c biogenesis protein CcmG, thiol:disulfide interchange protein DsbE [Pseudovibrio axinellae]
MANDMDEEKKTGISPLFLMPLIIFGALTILFAAMMFSDRDPQELPSALINKPAPEFKLPSVIGLERDGMPVPGFQHSDLLGQVTVVNIFASWCAPCRAEHRYLMDLSKDDRFQIAGLNYKDTDVKANRFLSELGNPYDRVGFDTGRVGIEWGVYGVPETFIVDEKAQIRYKFVGPLSEASYRDVFLPELEKILNEAK